MPWTLEFLDSPRIPVITKLLKYIYNFPRSRWHWTLSLKVNSLVKEILVLPIKRAVVDTPLLGILPELGSLGHYIRKILISGSNFRIASSTPVFKFDFLLTDETSVEFRENFHISGLLDLVACRHEAHLDFLHH